MMPPRENILFLAGLLAAIVLIGYAVAGQPAEPAAAQEARAELRRDAAAARACPPGHAVLWIDPRTMQCMKERE